MSFLAEKKGWTIECTGNTPLVPILDRVRDKNIELTIYYGDNYLPTNELPQFVQGAERIVELLKGVRY